MRVFITRTEMAIYGSRAYAYEAYVPLEDVAHKSYVTYHTITTDPNGNRIKTVSLAEATRPERQRLMPRGFPKLRAWEAHEKEADKDAWRMVNLVFPETVGLGLETMPALWATFDAPPNLDHAVRWAKDA